MKYGKKHKSGGVLIEVEPAISFTCKKCGEKLNPPVQDEYVICDKCQQTDNPKNKP